MAHTAGEVIEGKDLMLYIDTSTTGTAQYTPQAMATNHTITYNTETKERLTKDSPGGNPEKRIVKTTVSIKADALSSFGGAAKKFLLAALKAKKLVKLKYGFAVEETGDEYEEGDFVIDSLEETSQVGEDVTYSAQFSSSGEVETKTKSA